jgi:uncharacterized coiled-coil protein SlyX
VGDLDQVVLAQQKQIESLEQTLAAQRAQLDVLDSTVESASKPEDEKPPHY